MERQRQVSDGQAHAKWLSQYMYQYYNLCNTTKNSAVSQSDGQRAIVERGNQDVSTSHKTSLHDSLMTTNVDPIAVGEELNALYSSVLQENQLLPERSISRMVRELESKLSQLKVAEVEFETYIDTYLVMLFKERKWKKKLNTHRIRDTFGSSSARKELTCYFCKLHFPSEQYPCRFCDKKFQTIIDTYWHENTVHETVPNEPAECCFCSEQFNLDMEALKLHIYQKHFCFKEHLVCPFGCANLIIKENEHSLHDHMDSFHYCNECDESVLIESTEHQDMFHTVKASLVRSKKQKESGSSKSKRRLRSRSPRRHSRRRSRSRSYSPKNKHRQYSEEKSIPRPSSQSSRKSRSSKSRSPDSQSGSSSIRSRSDADNINSGRVTISLGSSGCTVVVNADRTRMSVGLYPVFDEFQCLPRKSLVDMGFIHCEECFLCYYPKLFVCKTCNLIFLSNNFLLDHLIRDHCITETSEERTCQYCSVTVSNIHDLVLHELLHYCDHHTECREGCKTLVSGDARMESLHYQEVHQNNATQKLTENQATTETKIVSNVSCCPICQFNRTDNEAIFECSDCFSDQEFVYIDFDEYRNHMSSSHGQQAERMFSCNLCNLPCDFWGITKFMEHRKSVHFVCASHIRCRIQECGQILPTEMREIHIQKRHPERAVPAGLVQQQLNNFEVTFPSSYVSHPFLVESICEDDGVAIVMSADEETANESGEEYNMSPGLLENLRLIRSQADDTTDDDDPQEDTSFDLEWSLKRIRNQVSDNAIEENSLADYVSTKPTAEFSLDSDWRVPKPVIASEASSLRANIGDNTWSNDQVDYNAPRRWSSDIASHKPLSSSSEHVSENTFLPRSQVVPGNDRLPWQIKTSDTQVLSAPWLHKAESPNLEDKYKNRNENVINTPTSFTDIGCRGYNVESPVVSGVTSKCHNENYLKTRALNTPCNQQAFISSHEKSFPKTDHEPFSGVPITIDNHAESLLEFQRKEEQRQSSGARSTMRTYQRNDNNRDTNHSSGNNSVFTVNEQMNNYISPVDQRYDSGVNNRSRELSNMSYTHTPVDLSLDKFAVSPKRNWQGAPVTTALFESPNSTELKGVAVYNRSIETLPPPNGWKPLGIGVNLGSISDNSLLSCRDILFKCVIKVSGLPSNGDRRSITNSATYQCSQCSLTTPASGINNMVHYVCPTCSCVLLSLDEIRAHANALHGAPPVDYGSTIMCQYSTDCEFSASNSVTMVNHRLDAHSICREHFVCLNRECLFIFSSKRALFAHILEGRCKPTPVDNTPMSFYKFIGYDRYTCSSCLFFEFSKSSDFRSCSKCDSFTDITKFVDPSEYSIHFSVHCTSNQELQSDRNVSCTLCLPGADSFALKDLLSHRVTQHLRCTEHYRCYNPKCFTVFPTRSLLKLHAQTCDILFTLETEPHRSYQFLQQVLSLYADSRHVAGSVNIFCTVCRNDLLCSSLLVCKLCEIRCDATFINATEFLFHLAAIHNVLFSAAMRCHFPSCVFTCKLKDLASHLLSKHKICCLHYFCSCRHAFDSLVKLKAHQMFVGCTRSLLSTAMDTQSAKIPETGDDESVFNCREVESNEDSQKTVGLPTALRFKKSTAEVNKLIFAPVLKIHQVSADSVPAFEYRCRECNIVCHVKSQSQIKHVVCPFCSLVFLSLDEVKAHAQSLHGRTEDVKITCLYGGAVCNYVADSPLKLIEHRKEAHNICSQHLICPYRQCNSLFTSVKKLSNHIRLNVCSQVKLPSLVKSNCSQYCCVACTFTAEVDYTSLVECPDSGSVKFPSKSDLSIHKYLEDQDCDDMILLQCPDEECPRKWFRLIEYFVHRDSKHKICGMHYSCKNRTCRIAMPSLSSIQLHHMVCTGESHNYAEERKLELSLDSLTVNEVVNKVCFVTTHSSRKVYRCSVATCGVLLASNTLLQCKLCSIHLQPVFFIDSFEFLVHLRACHKQSPRLDVFPCTFGCSGNGIKVPCKFVGKPEEVQFHRKASHRVCEMHYCCSFNNCYQLFDSIESMVSHRVSEIHQTEYRKIIGLHAQKSVEILRR